MTGVVGAPLDVQLVFLSVHLSVSLSMPRAACSSVTSADPFHVEQHQLYRCSGAGPSERPAPPKITNDAGSDHPIIPGARIHQRHDPLQVVHRRELDGDLPL